MGRVCEEFNCLPSQAIRELENDAVDGVVMRIIEMRAFARAKEAYDRVEEEADMPTGKMVQLVKEIDFAVAREDIAAAKANLRGEG